MKRYCLCLVVFNLLLIYVQAQQKDTVYVADYGSKPNTYRNSTESLQAAIKACKDMKAKVLVFENGRYDFWTEGAARKEYFISNTSTEEECPSKIKTVGLLFEDMEGLTIEGSDATLMFHGKITMIAFDRCKEMKFQNMHLDFERPGGSEVTYKKHDENGVEAAIHRDSRYQIVDGKINLYGEGWQSNRNHCIEYDPESEHFFYSQGWNTLASSKAEELAPGIVRFKTPLTFQPKIGNTLTVRDIIRDQVGMFIFESEDITLNNVDVNYMHGLGIVSQYTKNVTMKEVRCMPREGSGRILASSADFMHFSGCSGKISIIDCHFEGAQDDPINVHGTNLRVVEKIDEKTLKLRFMHGQSYGYNAYFERDTVAFLRASTMERISLAQVTSMKRLTDRILEVRFDRAIPQDLELNHDCVENMSCTPEVEVRNCFFSRTSTRGTLVTTPRKVVIADNVYYKTGMSAILIEGDAEGWYESGPVKDVLIQNNKFIGCGYNGGPENAVIAIHPSNTVINADRPVHRNVRIIGNTFETFGNPVLYAKSTQDLIFQYNKVVSVPKKGFAEKSIFILNGCKGVLIKMNDILSGKTSFREIDLKNMKKKYIKTDLNF